MSAHESPASFGLQLLEAHWLNLPVWPVAKQMRVALRIQSREVVDGQMIRPIFLPSQTTERRLSVSSKVTAERSEAVTREHWGCHPIRKRNQKSIDGLGVSSIERINDTGSNSHTADS